ncbi:MAG: NlpC/P60 family protein [Balneolaceae bacterium]
MYQKLYILILIGLLVSSCGLVKRGTIPWEERAKEKVNKPSIAIATATIPSTNGNVKLSKGEKEIKSSLDLAFKDWKGVPYVLGGTGYNGVDCSSFMQIVFADYFEIELPRNTREQMKEGSSVKKNKIQLGDMIFFKTGRNSYHVGVMINNEQFLHASTSSGVMISGIQERYWANAYLTTRRIL